jgi:hypothetical protein
MKELKEETKQKRCNIRELYKYTLLVQQNM